MTEIIVPNLDELTVNGPFLDVPAQQNRSVWTGRSQTIGLPGTELWSASVAVDLIATEIEERAWRRFLFALEGQVNWFKLPLPCNLLTGPQPVIGFPPNDGYTLPLTGIYPRTHILRAGQYITIPLPSGHKRAVCLMDDVIANSSGNATAQFRPALNEVPVVGAKIEAAKPFVPVRSAVSSLGCNQSQGISGFAFDVEEAL